MDQYIESSILTASPEKLVEMLYDKALELVKIAISNIDDNVKSNSALLRAEDIILYLNAILDIEKGGNIAKTLRELYDFVYRQLVAGNVSKDVKKLEVARDIIQEMLNTWKDAEKKAAKKPQQNKINFGVSV
jgi:flagellar protein FliS|uniref:Flagellar secretion chaperone FliS n=1 Tax=Mesoaciditoga lauensis TaxID=1495039 RepID=A0A7V3REJ0_9BACT